jgi:hypothetical protein
MHQVKDNIFNHHCMGDLLQLRKWSVDQLRVPDGRGILLIDSTSFDDHASQQAGLSSRQREKAILFFSRQFALILALFKPLHHVFKSTAKG